MDPTGIILVFACLALIGVQGIVLTAFGTAKLRLSVRSGPGTRAAIVTVSWQSILVVAGLAFLVYGVIGSSGLI